ncbi:MAG TPA: efflux RND transporter periplasmic adaptor subunit [Caulobacteraceae bacterium]|nr:efflux RND transporter periplasmic adaptor subunit [Caulobacteraceae bacterium]
MGNAFTPRIAAGTAVFAALVLLTGCGGGERSPAAPPVVQGERLVLRYVPAPDLKPVAATVTSRDAAEARARIAGTLVRLEVRAGDLVRRGQVIAVVSDPRIGLETRAYDAQVAAAQAQSISASAELARTQDLFEHGVYAKARLEQMTAAAHAAAGALGAARAQRAASAELGAQGAIVAPADGRVLKADVPAGSVVQPGQSIATLTAGPIVLRVETPEADAAGLKVGQTVDIAPGQPGVPAGQAKIVQVYPAVDAGKVIADLDAPGLSNDLIGRRVALRLALGQRQALLVPVRFVITRSGVDYVRVLEPDGTADETPVQVAPGPSAMQVEVLSGAAAGDVLVAPGAGR